MTTNANPTAKDEDHAMLLQGEIADALNSEIGLKREIAADWASRVVANLRRRLGTQRIYIPQPSRADRDEAIYREYNGTNGAELCQRFGIGKARLHQIYTEQVARRRASSPLSCLKTGRHGG